MSEDHRPGRGTHPRPGDVVSRPKGLVEHVGLVVDGGRVLHNIPGRGEHVTSLSEFSAGRPVRIERSPPEERLMRLARAGHDGTGRDYHLLRNNCEHTVSRVSDGEPRSRQLLGWSLGAVGAVAGGLLLRHPGGAVAGFELGRRLARRLR
ncbi:MAG: lecithin retinol acyltransferase family protein [Pseudomonadales bacterium]|jgi:hypothetical protein|nr:lecithin retinol acyltransferase family protein [Pseudomonadales bacterium]